MRSKTWDASLSSSNAFRPRSGPCTDGQVLVLQDLWGIDGDHAPKFVRRYIDGDAVLTDALDRYDADVKGGRFPGAAESYS
jgi:3-methyl-2-oxobutanoate hydroxymethyltransferase